MAIIIMSSKPANTPETIDPLPLGESEEERINGLCEIFKELDINILENLVSLTPYDPVQRMYAAVKDRLRGDNPS